MTYASSAAVLSLLVASSWSASSTAFVPLLSSHKNAPTCSTTPTCLAATSSRRSFGIGALASFTTSLLLPLTDAVADESIVGPPVDMKLFVDPKGLFAMTVPSRFYKIRRTDKGDLPDEKTGKGRRGSNIFTAGDLGKAEIIAVERFPTRVLLEENGIEATGDLSTFPSIGEPAAIANLINLRREKEKISNTMIFPDSVRLSEDKKEIRFKLKTEIDVQKPELLYETYGVRQLFRLTTAKATLNANDGNILAVFASALEQDFTGRDGEALDESVSSFKVTDQAAKN